MKKILTMFVMVFMLASFVAATETTLTEDELEMNYMDEEVVTFCLYENGVAQNVDVDVSPICMDANGRLGCTSGDVFEPSGFSVVPSEATTGDDGCVDLTVTTNNAEVGLYYYTVNGKVGGSRVGYETGKVYVPEFGTIGAALALVGAGMVVYKRRK